MNSEKVMLAEKYATEFLARIEDVRERAKHDSTLFMLGSPETAALRRASMELTRVLAELRRPG